MNRIKRTFLTLLQGKITYNDQVVPVVIKDFPYDKTPCITITGMNRDKGKYRRQYVKGLTTVAPNHQSNNPNQTYPTLIDFTIKSYDISINIWCNNETERELIVNQVKDCLFYCMNHHRDYCIQYDRNTKICATTGQQCASYFDNGFKGLRCQCPDPVEYDYCNLLTYNRIRRSSIVIDPDYEQDEYDRHEPLKRSIIEISLDYEFKRELPSYPTQSISMDFNE